MSLDSTRVAAIYPVYEPDYADLKASLSSLASQSRSPDEVVIVDGTPDSERNVSVSGAPYSIHTLHVENPSADDPRHPISYAEREGQKATDARYVIRMDEDDVLASPHYIAYALEDLHQPGVVGVGGDTVPLDGNPSGRVISKLSAWSHSQLTCWGLVYDRSMCKDGVCTPLYERDDIGLRQTLSSVGVIEYDQRLSIRRHLPTTGQQDHLTIAVLLGVPLAGLVGLRVARRSSTRQ